MALLCSPLSGSAALRIFARTSRDDPTRLIHKAKLTAGDSLDDKMRRLLKFYEACLPDSQKKALGLLALFRIPVGETTLAPLWKHNDSLHDVLHDLHIEGLLTADPAEDGNPRYACHPILRDHFRTQFIGQPDFAREAASLIAGPPDAQKVRSLEAVQIIATAIEMLLDAGEVKAADDLFMSRLETDRLFLRLPAPHWGMQVARNFVRTQACRQAIAQQLSENRLSFYLNEVGLFANYAGEPETALEFYREAISLYRNENDDRRTGMTLQNLVATEISVGYLVHAAGHLAEALELVSTDEREKADTLTLIAYAATLRGDVNRADANFEEANAIEHRIQSGEHDLYSTRGIQWAEHLIRIRPTKRARQLTEANRKICDREGWQQDVARCEWILGWLDTLASDYPNAHAHLNRAKATFTAGHMIYDLARVFITESACHLGQSQWNLALASCERALQLAAPRSYRLIHADALNLRARIKLERPDPDPTGARDDAEAALQLADFCDYHWARLDARTILKAVTSL
jgi:tetratricopeptide (TPR) repeat protein